MKNFGSHLKERLLSPRIVIYSLMAIGFAWFMNHYSPAKLENQASMPPSPPAWHEEKSVDAKRPMIIVFSGQALDKELSSAIDSFQAFQDICPVMTLVVDEESKSSIQPLFNIQDYPCAILIDSSNHELGRISSPITLETLTALKNKLNEEQPSSNTP